MVLMSALKDRLRADLTTAIKARDDLRSSTLRMVLTAITNAEVAGKVARELSDDDVLGVLSTEAKRRREAATSSRRPVCGPPSAWPPSARCAPSSRECGATPRRHGNSSAATTSRMLFPRCPHLCGARRPRA